MRGTGNRRTREPGKREQGKRGIGEHEVMCSIRREAIAQILQIM